MQQLFQSAFLQALGFAIVNSLWQTALVWLIYMLCNLLPVSSAIKYRFAVAAQFTSFAWFIITLQFYYTEYSHTWLHTTTVAPQNIQAIMAGDTGFSSQLISYFIKAEQGLPYVSMAYILLMLFLSVRWIIGYRQTQQVRNDGLQKIAVEWRLFVRKTAAQLGIKKEIQLFLSENITTPLTIGFLKPMILIPVASINHLSTDQLEAVLLHELAHIKRYDYLANMILSVIEISLFFNPFTQLLSKNIRKERENSCDDWVLQFQYSASVYADALLRIAYLQSAPAFAMTATGKKNDLLARVKRMIGQKENRFNYRKQLLAWLIVTGMLSSIAWLNPVTPVQNRNHLVAISNQNTAVQKIKSSSSPEEPMVVRADNPFFNPVFFLSNPLKAEIKKSLASAQKEIDAWVVPDADSKEPVFIESIQPLVVNALEQASFEMTDKTKNWDKELKKMELAKIKMEKLFFLDSLQVQASLAATVKEDIARSLKSIDIDIANMKMDMKKVSRMKIDFSVEQEKAKKEIEKAIKEINKSGGLDKLVMNALKIPGMLLEENNQPVQIKTLRRKQPEKIHKPAKKKEISSPEINAFVTDLSFGNIFTPAVLASLSSLTSLEKLDIRTALLQEAGKIKVSPAVCKETKTEEKKIVIQMQ